MASTPVILLLKRSGNAADRPSGITIQAGEAALAFGAADPGLYFKDSAGGIRKVGPPAYSTTAPNASPVGLAGNSVGEIWVDSSTSAYYLRVWTGSGWQKIGAAFADDAQQATVVLASGAIVANSAILASGALFANLASGALFANLASGALFANSASGVLTATGVSCADIFTGTLTGTGPSGSLRYKADDSGSPSGLYVAYAGGWALV
jgi:hypothetical protein